jgi:host factor-I protein
MSIKNPSEGTTGSAAAEEFVSRKLIRPALAPQNRAHASDAKAEQRPIRAARAAAAPEQTHAEVFYFQKQIQSKTQVTIVLRNGETFEGVLEWYDRNSLRLLRRDQSNLMIFKTAIKYMFKTSETNKR